MAEIPSLRKEPLCQAAHYSAPHRDGRPIQAARLFFPAQTLGILVEVFVFFNQCKEFFELLHPIMFECSCVH